MAVAVATCGNAVTCKVGANIFGETLPAAFTHQTKTQGHGRYAKIITGGPTQASGPVLILP